VPTRVSPRRCLFIMSFLLSITTLSCSRVVFFIEADIGAEITECRDVLDLSLDILFCSELSLDL
jgi:hypothetical protein